MGLLSEEETLADAGEVINDLVSDLAHLSGAEQAVALQSAAKVFEMSAEIIDAMLYGKNATKH
jgi:hypothetical protein